MKKFEYTKAIREIEKYKDLLEYNKARPTTRFMVDELTESQIINRVVQIINNNIIETEEINIEDDKYHDLLQKYIKLSDKYFDLQCKHIENDRIEKLIKRVEDLLEQINPEIYYNDYVIPGNIYWEKG
jgi:hypothetical protein